MANMFHVRSNSFPSGSHPNTIKVEEDLSKLKDWESTSTSKSIGTGLSLLEDLFISLEDLLNMASTQKVISHHQSDKSMEEILDASVTILDIPLLNQDHQLSAMIRVLREVIAMSMSTFQSLLSFLAVPASKSKANKWLLVAKLMHRGVIACEENNENVNELQCVEASLSTLLCDGSNITKIKAAHGKLETLENAIESLENGLESIFRHLVKTRASLLNMMTL